MCIIIAKNKGIELPTKDILLNCYNHNPDGCGYAFTKDNKVYIKKGYFDFETFYNDLIKNVNKENQAIIHFRITTHGGKSAELTHPFCLAKKFNFITAKRIKTDLAIAHNGILSITSNAKNPHSDTTLFIKKYLSEIITKRKDLKNKNKIAIINNLISYGNKLAFLTSDNILLLGRGWIEKGGLSYSNTSYLKNDFKTLYTSKYNLFDFEY